MMKLIIIFALISFITCNNYCTDITETVERTKLKISSIKKNSFNTCTALLVVDFSHNLLELIPDDMFPNNKRLWSINFSRNRILFLQRDFFKELDNLTHFDISYNKLVYFHFPSLIFTQTSHLNIAHNQIINFKKRSLCHLKHLM